jgi:hypothetical protein
LIDSLCVWAKKKKLIVTLTVKTSGDLEPSSVLDTIEVHKERPPTEKTEIGVVWVDGRHINVAAAQLLDKVRHTEGD